MRQNPWTRSLASVAITAVMSVTALAQEAASAMTQPGSTETAPAAATAVQATPTTQTTTTFQDYNSSAVRQEFHSLLRRHPDEVAIVLKYDPSLFRNEAYMANYPQLAAFVREHPEVAQNPRFFLDAEWITARIGGPRMTPGERATNDMIEGISIAATMIGVGLVLGWIIRTLLAHRRWSRAWKVQTELNNKMIDRLTSHEELLRYVESGGGGQFLGPAMMPVTSARPEAAAPLSRILWAVQAGVVVIMLGIGFLLVSLRASDEVGGSLFGFGVLGLCAGLGLAASAAVSYALSQKLGLMKPPVEANE